MAEKLPNPLNSGGSSDFLAFSTTSTNSGGGNNSSGSSDFLAFRYEIFGGFSPLYPSKREENILVLLS